MPFGEYVKILISTILFFSLVVLSLLSFDDNDKVKRKIYNNYINIKYSLFDAWYYLDSERRGVAKLSVSADEKDKDRFIAHAGGKIDTHIYTDSLEALNANYKKGFRLFELDILKTKDNFFVASHDWKRWKKIAEYDKSIPPSLDEFKRYKIYNKYTPLTMDDINNWFGEHKDAILVTDKINDPLGFSAKFIDKKRLVMELFDWYAVYQAKRENITAMPTGNLVIGLKRNIFRKLKDMNITHIAISRRFENKKLLKKLRENNIKVYAFHVNYDEGKDEKFTFCNEFKYFYGMYADEWQFKKIDCNITE